eukprot:167486-Ditylum_brightwellii.AAC.1
MRRQRRRRRAVPNCSASAGAERWTLGLTAPAAPARLGDEDGWAYGEVGEGMYGGEEQDEDVACFYLLGHFLVDKFGVGVHRWVATVCNGGVDVGWA